MSRIEQLITEIEEYIDSCKFQPLSTTKIIVNKEELDELLVELRLRIPDEIKQYQKIISNQDAIISDAQAKADAMLADATAQTNELVNEHEIMQKAYAHANEIIEQAQAQAQAILDNAVNDANNIRQGSIQYTDDMLKSLQTIINHSMEGAQSRFDAYMNSMKSSYDIVSSNRQELSAGPSRLRRQGRYAEGTWRTWHRHRIHKPGRHHRQAGKRAWSRRRSSGFRLVGIEHLMSTS